MEKLTQEMLQELLQHDGPPCVSLYMPAYQAPPERDKNRIRLKNLLGEARGQLTDADDPPAIDALLAPAERLIGQGRSRAFHGEGLAIFLAPGFARIHSLPMRFQPFVLVSGRFHLKPLLPLFTNNTTYFVLSLSQEETRLWQGTRFGLEPMELPGFPVRLEEITAHEDPERQVQFHTQTRPAAGSGGRQAIFHGNAEERLKQSRLRRYFALVDERVRPALGDTGRPLVLAGVEYLFSLYREANSYPHLIDAGAAGSPEGMTGDELHRRTWAILQPFVDREIEAAVARYADLSGTGRVADDVGAIVTAARRGRVETLFAARDRQRWGVLTANGEPAATTDSPPAYGAVDLLDEAVVQTLRNGGDAYLLPPAQMPGDGDLAAVYRY